MKLNELKPADGAKHPRNGLGAASARAPGKTAGRGHKGQKSRSGGFHKVGFEGGQMPLQRRLPKRGFKSQMAGRTAEVRLSDLERMDAIEVDLLLLKQAGVVLQLALAAKVILSGSLTRKVSVKGLGVTKGARAAIEAAGGSVQLEQAAAAEPAAAE